jgi:hypothetical protein
MPRVSADGINRSEEIRRFLRENPGVRIQDCIDGLKGRGIEVSYGLVASVRSRDSGKKVVQESPVTAEEACRVRDFVKVSNLDDDVAVRILGDFANLVQLVGGLDRFRYILDRYEGFSDVKESSSSYYDVNDDED